MFLLATAGVMLVGFIQAVRRVSPHTALVLGGLLTAPIPASLVGEGQAIWRALPIVPFGVLTAVIGLQRFWDTGSDREQRISFVAALASVVALAAIYHGQQPYAQAFVRASLVPLTVVGLSVLVGGLDVGPRQLIGAAAVTVVSLLPIQIALFVVDYSVVLDLAPWFAAVLGGVLLLPSAWLARHRLHAPAAIAFLAVVASEFAYFHIERAGLPRLPLIPAGAVLPVTRFAVAFAAVAAAVATAARAEGPRRATIAPLVVLVVIQIAYFRVDYFAGDGARLVHVAAVLLATVWLVVQLGHHVDRRHLAAVTTAAVLTVASLQFAYFYVYYLTSYQQHFSPDGSVRAVMERVIERAGDRPAATVYFWNFGHPGLDDWYWRFYTTKHHRESLAARTIRGEEPVAAAVDRIRNLPEGSLVVTRPSNDLDRAIDRMRGAGYVEETEILRTSDGRPVFWILERRAK